MNGTNCNENERGLLPYPVILAATKGDPDAMKIVMQHYQSYIAHLSMKKIRDESGNTYYGVDEDLRERLQAKLICSLKSCVIASTVVLLLTSLTSVPNKNVLKYLLE